MINTQCRLETGRTRGQQTSYITITQCRPEDGSDYKVKINHVPSRVVRVI